MYLPAVPELRGEPEFNVLASGFGFFTTTREAAETVMDQCQSEIGPDCLHRVMQLSDVAHVCRARSDADEKSVVGEISDQQSGEVGESGPDFVKVESSMTVALFREGRAEKHDVKFGQDGHGLGIKGISA